MRELKFRVWDCEESEFLQVSSLGIEDDGSVWYVQAIDDREVKIDPPYFPDSDKIVIMQYIGLKDKNGVEIYEGDIVSQHEGGIHFDKDSFDLDVVKWMDFGWSPFVEVIGHKCHDFKGNLFEYIIIGNIYENPELLK